MAKRKKRIDLENIPTTLEKIAALIDQQIDSLAEKPELTKDDSKLLIDCAAILTSMYKDYRAQIQQIEKDLKTKSKEEIMSMIKAESVS